MSIYNKNPGVIYCLIFLTKDKSALLFQTENKIYKTLGIDNLFKRFKIVE